METKQKRFPWLVTTGCLIIMFIAAVRMYPTIKKRFAKKPAISEEVVGDGDAAATVAQASAQAVKTDQVFIVMPYEDEHKDLIEDVRLNLSKGFIPGVLEPYPQAVHQELMGGLRSFFKFKVTSCGASDDDSAVFFLDEISAGSCSYASIGEEISLPLRLRQPTVLRIEARRVGAGGLEFGLKTGVSDKELKTKALHTGESESWSMEMK